jgi:hypothetical protein
VKAEKGTFPPELSSRWQCGHVSSQTRDSSRSAPPESFLTLSSSAVAAEALLRESC